MKMCCRCKKRKHKSWFSRKAKSASGLASYCKKCAAKYYANYYKKNATRLKLVSGIYHKNNRKSILAYKKEYRIKNAIQIKKTIKAWLIKNKSKIALYRASYQRKRRSDPRIRFIDNIRNRTRFAFKVNKFTKKSGIAKLLGCSFRELKIHMESQFKRGMTWSNYGRWHIDHIKPIGKAKNKKQAIALSHYTNLQPLWAKDNFKKGAKYEQ